MRSRGVVMAGWGLVRVVLVSLCVLVCGGVVGVGPAAATVSQFGGGEGTGGGEFNSPHGIAVEQESGDVYVVDRNNARVQKFGAEGEFMFAWGWGVADGHTEAPQTCTVCFVAGLGGSGGGQLSAHGAEGVAVDNDPLSASHGDVYVFDIGNSRVDKFDSAGGFLLTFGHEVNATTHGNVCLVGEACQAGTRGTGTGEFEPENGDSIAVNPAGFVLVGDENRVQEFSPGGVLEGHIALPGVGRISALAVDSSGDVYVEGRELAGVRKFDGSGSELGEPRDASGEPSLIAVGPADELFINDGTNSAHHILEDAAAGSEVASFDAGVESVPRGGLAFGDGIGELYVVNSGVVRLVGAPPAGPLVVGGSVGEAQPTTAIVSAVLNAEGHEASYHVEYGTSVSYGASTVPGTLAAGFEDTAVSIGLSGLSPRTMYHFRVVASSSAGTVVGPDETSETLPPALIDSESVSQVTTKTVTLAAQINPLDRDTKYRFEYGPSAAYGASVPVSDGDAGSGTVDVAVDAPVEGLLPGATYHYHVEAVNSLGIVDGPDRMFKTQAIEASGLPDDRAWEMVSPPNKHGATLEALSPTAGGAIQAAQNGSSVSYLATGPVDGEPSGNRSLAFTQVLSTRGGKGWASRGIATPNETAAFTGFLVGGEYELFSEDLSIGLVEPVGDTPLSPAASEPTPYRREANGEYTPLITAANVPPGIKFGGIYHQDRVEFRGASPDLSHLVLTSRQALTPGFVSGGSKSLFEWADGSLHLISVLPDGKPAAEEGEQALLGRPNFDVRRAISDDGSRIAWTALGPAGGHLYLRDMRLGKTVQLDVVEEGAQGGPGEALYQTASGDGSKVFFTDEARLTRDATARPGEPDLYMCEIGTSVDKLECALKDLTVDKNAGEAADVHGIVLEASEDGRYVYFAADGVLVPGAAPGNCSLAMCNLYVYDTLTSKRRLIAALSSEDDADWNGIFFGSPLTLTARVSPSGRYLAFMSERSLTGYDNIDVHSGKPDTEVFLYDASSSSLVCASCDPTGARPAGVFDIEEFPGLLVDPNGIATLWAGHWLAGSVPGWQDGSGPSGGTSWYQSRYLSDSGRLFFDAADALVPGDTNGLEDVYEYEPNGVGGCSGSAGCVGLISSGTSGKESAFLDASESGNDVFFLTSSRLVPQDVDGALDVYDAHVCTSGSPCIATPPVVSSAPSCASGDGCRGLGSGQAGVFAVPSSTDVSGAGSLAPRPLAGPAKVRRLTRAQKLASALRMCRKKAQRKQQLRRKRQSICEARARRLFGNGVTAKGAMDAGATKKGNR